MNSADDTVSLRKDAHMSSTRRCQLRTRKSRFVDIFRTTPPKTVCPNFYVLAHADGCSFAPQCSYCYLKSSLWYLGGKPQAFTNTRRMIAEVRRWLARSKLESYILNTGNLSDSLTFEESRPLMRALIETFRQYAAGRPHTLLIVTKGGQRECRTLFETSPCANVVASFSVNNSDAAQKHERGAALVADRLKAAARLKKLGWRLRMRIDPMIQGYDYTGITRAVKELRPERITLGTLRAEKNLPRFVENGLFAGLVPASDPKSLARYPLATRLALYRPAVAELRNICPVGLCEEMPEVWDALGLDKAAKACNCGA
jgi:DNA repair photolyase